MDAMTPQGEKPRFDNFRFREGDDALIETMVFDHQAVLWTPGNYIEIAAKLGIEKIGTVKSRVHRARTKLVKMRTVTTKATAP